MFELEYAAGDDFELAIPIPPHGAWDLGARVDVGGTGSLATKLAYEGYTIPNDTYVTDGNKSFSLKARASAVSSPMLRRSSVATQTRTPSPIRKIIPIRPASHHNSLEELREKFEIAQV